eukprot:360946-Chlamydomonas_euryale.AAC.15
MLPAAPRSSVAPRPHGSDAMPPVSGSTSSTPWHKSIRSTQRQRDAAAAASRGVHCGQGASGGSGSPAVAEATAAGAGSQASAVTAGRTASTTHGSAEHRKSAGVSVAAPPPHAGGRPTGGAASLGGEAFLPAEGEAGGEGGEAREAKLSEITNERVRAAGASAARCD